MNRYMVFCLGILLGYLISDSNKVERRFEAALEQVQSDPKLKQEVLKCVEISESNACIMQYDPVYKCALKVINLKRLKMD